MQELAVYMPLAQLNTSGGGAPVENTGGATGAGATAGAGAAAAPAASGTTGTAGTAGAATTSATGTATGPAKQDPGPFGGMGLILPMIVMLGVVYVFLFRNQRKDEKRRKAQLSELKKGDRVMTIGGMLAKVVSIDGEEVVLKIDEAANVKATYRKSAIQEVIDRDKKE